MQLVRRDKSAKVEWPLVAKWLKIMLEPEVYVILISGSDAKYVAQLYV